MSRWALVPAKAFARGKSRLAPALSDEARAAFARGLFDHVLATLTASGAVDGILVATDSDVVAEAAHAHGASVRRDDGAAGPLSAVVDAGLAELTARGATHALVLMADLPHLTADDVRALLAALEGADVVVVRADDGLHTNALALAPPGCLPTRFGRDDSFTAHVADARAAGLRVAVVANERVAFDVDGPDDHARLQAARVASR
jgi:2-phospho-L-lactate guanylyltransferase